MSFEIAVRDGGGFDLAAGRQLDHCGADADPDEAPVARLVIVRELAAVPAWPKSLAANRIVRQTRSMSADEVDRYLGSVDEPKRTTLARLRQTILEIIPDAEQGISYGVPAFKVRGKTIAGFAAFKNHLSYLPHSGSVFPQLKEELAGYSMSSGALRFDVDKPLPRQLVARLISVRLDQAFPG